MQKHANKYPSLHVTQLLLFCKKKSQRQTLRTWNFPLVNGFPRGCRKWKIPIDMGGGGETARKPAIRNNADIEKVIFRNVRHTIRFRFCGLCRDNWTYHLLYKTTKYMAEVIQYRRHDKKLYLYTKITRCEKYIMKYRSVLNIESSSRN